MLYLLLCAQCLCCTFVVFGCTFDKQCKQTTMQLTSVTMSYKLCSSQLLNPSYCDSKASVATASSAAGWHRGTKCSFLLQAVTASHQLPTYPRLMSQAEQAKVLQACSLLQVDVSINPAAASTSISLQGTAERVRRVSMLFAIDAVLAVLCLLCCAEVFQHRCGSLACCVLCLLRCTTMPDRAALSLITRVE